MFLNLSLSLLNEFNLHALHGVYFIENCYVHGKIILYGLSGRPSIHHVIMTQKTSPAFLSIGITFFIQYEKDLKQVNHRTWNYPAYPVILSNIYWFRHCRVWENIDERNPKISHYRLN